MENNKILTISIAAYNLENMIEQNLESIEKCEKKDSIEAIIIDDGSKDHTAEIVQKYVDKYPNVFKLIKQKNTGAGSTVNVGIQNATGKFFKMIDGDDWVVSENLDKLVDLLSASDSDIILTNTLIYNEKERKVTKIEKPTVEPQINASFEDICKNLNNMQMQFVTYKTSILQEKNIKLDNGFYTDVEYLLLPVPFLDKVDIYDLDIYMYRVAREGQSVSLGSRQKHIDMHNLVLERLIKYYEENKKNLKDNSKEYMAKRIASMEDMQLGTMLSLKSSSKEIKKYNNNLKELSEDIYKIYSNKTKCSILLKSNYILTRMLSRLFIIKNKEK